MSIRELAHVDSACTVGDARAGVRVDPFWSGLWRSGLGSAWWDRKLLASHVDAGLVRDGAFNMDQGQAFESFCCGGGGPVWSGRLRGLAGLGSWRVVTNQQLAAVSGFSGWASASSSTVRAGFGAGLLRMGLFAGGVPSSSTGPVFLLRPGSEKVFGHLSRRLSYWDWLSITGGLPWRVGGLFPRHNVLMSELGLLAAELLPQEFRLSFGERWSGTDQLLGAHGNKSGDGLLVRDDGLRVVVELTASAAPALEQKVDAWASLLARNRLASSGVVVVFVVAAPDKSDRVARRTRKVVRSAIARYGLSGDVASRLFVIDWRDWFPGPGLVDDSFFALRVWGRPGRDWQLFDLAGDNRLFAGQSWSKGALGTLACLPPWVGVTPEKSVVAGVVDQVVSARGLSGLVAPDVGLRGFGGLGA